MSAHQKPRMAWLALFALFGTVGHVSAAETPTASENIAATTATPATGKAASKPAAAEKPKAASKPAEKPAHPQLAVYNAAMKKGDYPAALQALRRMAEDGRADAQWFLGTSLIRGAFGSPDVIEGSSWLRLAADQGNEAAQLYLLLAYKQSGVNLGPHLSTVFADYRSRAEKGEVVAMVNLGLMYQYGRGVEMNLAQAVQWYERAAGKGSGRAMTYLGRLYDGIAGDAFPADRNKAGEWFARAAKAGHGHGMDSYAVLLSKQKKPAKEWLAWYHKSVETGYPNAFTNLGRYYRDGIEGALKRDTSQALTLFRYAANDLMYPDGWIELGALYERGVAVAPSAAEAWAAYENAFEFSAIGYGREDALFGLARVLGAYDYQPKLENANEVVLDQLLPLRERWDGVRELILKLYRKRSLELAQAEQCATILTELVAENAAMAWDLRDSCDRITGVPEGSQYSETTFHLLVRSMIRNNMSEAVAQLPGDHTELENRLEDEADELEARVLRSREEDLSATRARYADHIRYYVEEYRGPAYLCGQPSVSGDADVVNERLDEFHDCLRDFFSSLNDEEIPDEVLEAMTNDEFERAMNRMEAALTEKADYANEMATAVHDEVEEENDAIDRQEFVDSLLEGLSQSTRQLQRGY